MESMTPSCGISIMDRAYQAWSQSVPQVGMKVVERDYDARRESLTPSFKLDFPGMGSAMLMHYRPVQQCRWDWLWKYMESLIP